MNKRVILGAFLIGLFLVMVGTAVSQNQRTGTSAASELLIPVGGRDLALSGSTLAVTQGVEAIYWNPAGLGRMQGSAQGMFSSMSYIADIGISYGAIAARFGEFGNVGLSIKSLDFGDIPLTTVADPEGRGGATFSPSYVTLGFTYSRQITDAASVGATVKLVSESIERVSATGMAFDIGLQYRGLLDLRGLSVGIVVKNIGPQMKFDGSGLLRPAVASGGLRPEQQYKSEAAPFELPSMIELGVSYAGTIQDNIVYGLNGSFANNNLYEDEYHVGGELGMTFGTGAVFGRVGYNMIPTLSNQDDRIFGATYGFGLMYNAGGTELSVDFAYRQARYFDGNTVVSFKVGF